MFKQPNFKDFMGKIKPTQGNLLNRFRIMPVMNPNIKSLMEQAQNVTKKASNYFQK